MKTKICKKCGNEKNLDRFSKTNRTIDGHVGTCMDCGNKKSNDIYHEIKNGTHVKRKIKQFNDKYFEKIDTEQKAYWVGFLYADGYVRKKHDGGEFKLKLSMKDRKHIEKLKDHLNAEQDIIDSVEYFKKDNRQYKSEYSVFKIYSLKLVNDLINIGCVETKTQKIRFPKLNDEYIYHFIRGYFDGDGSIHKHKDRSNIFSICITSNVFFINQLHDFLNMGRIENFKNHSNLIINKINDIKLFRDLIYKGATIYLDRKKEVFNKIIDNFKRDYSLTKNKYTYKITDPNGNKLIVDHLKNFCTENGLVYSSMSNLSRGVGNSCYGYKCELIKKLGI